MISTACPYCLIMLDDATKGRQAEGTAPESVRVMDVAQVLEQSVAAAAPPLARGSRGRLTGGYSRPSAPPFSRPLPID